MATKRKRSLAYSVSFEPGTSVPFDDIDYEEYRDFLKEFENECEINSKTCTLSTNDKSKIVDVILKYLIFIEVKAQSSKRKWNETVDEVIKGVNSGNYIYDDTDVIIRYEKN